MNKSYKYRIYPNENLKYLIERTFECCDFMVDYCLDKLEIDEDNYNEMDMMIEFDFYQMKTGNFKDIFGDPVTYRMKQVYQVYKNFKNNEDRFLLLRNKMIGLNKYRINHWFGDVYYNEKYIHTFVYGNLKIKGDPILKGDVINKSTSNKYFISICCRNIEQIEFPKNNKAIGIDMGLYHFMTLSDGTKYENPRFLQKSIKSIKTNRRQLAKKVKGSNNYEKNRVRLSKKGRTYC